MKKSVMYGAMTVAFARLFVPLSACKIFAMILIVTIAELIVS
ncbi:hypothetical protein [Saccharococcus sp. Marseille-Q5394]|nr:hypothetical protein [Saccharococcus sp. Marseille-Q5394]